MGESLAEIARQELKYLKSLLAGREQDIERYEKALRECKAARDRLVVKIESLENEMQRAGL